MDGAAARLDDLLSALDGMLAPERGVAIGRFRAALQGIEPVLRDSGGRRFGLPVCRWWEAALEGAPEPLAAPLRALGPRLRWVQNPNYRRNPPDPRFLERYGYAVIAGPGNGPPAPAPHAALAMGVLLLGPQTIYPLHAHPAREIYVPLGEAEWWRREGPWRRRSPGSVIHHPPSIPHATRTGAAPLLAIYMWMGDIGQHARLVAGEMS